MLILPIKTKYTNWPNGSVYQEFGKNPADYAYLGLDGHNGIDIATYAGDRIYATSGTYVEVKNDPAGYGKHVRILTPVDFNGDCLEITYGHLQDVYAVLGKSCKDGELLGNEGNTGFVISGQTHYWGNAPANKGVHLHFGIRECSAKPTPWQMVYASGAKIYLKNYDNGFAGAVDPLKYIAQNLAKQVTLYQQIIALRQQILLAKNTSI